MKRKQKHNRCKFKYRATDNLLVPPTSHGSMYSSYMAEEEARRAYESTPLVHRPTPVRSSSRTCSVVAVAALGTIFCIGVIISTYLMHVQNMGPLEGSMMFVSREEWAHVVGPDHEPVAPAVAANDDPARHIVVVQTGGPTCDDIDECTKLLNEMQENNGEPLLYNFLLSSNGATFEGLGWYKKSPIFPNLQAFVVAFIGNFSNESPTTSQVEEAFTLVDTSNVRGYLSADFTIIGKILKSDEIPTYLFDALHTVAQWDRELSDDY